MVRPVANNKFFFKVGMAYLRDKIERRVHGYPIDMMEKLVKRPVWDLSRGSVLFSVFISRQRTDGALFGMRLRIRDAVGGVPL